MDRYFVLDEKGNPVPADAMTWARWFEDNLQARVIRQDTPGPDLFVSTVFLGMNHRVGAGPPLLYETMTFRDDEGVDCRRYSTRQEAEEGHALVVSELLNAYPGK